MTHPVFRLLTRVCYSLIESRVSWDQLLLISLEIRYELSFWFSNIDSINEPLSPKSSVVIVVYSDASDSGFGRFLVQCGPEFFLYGNGHLIKYFLAQL